MSTEILSLFTPLRLGQHRVRSRAPESSFGSRPAVVAERYAASHGLIRIVQFKITLAGAVACLGNQSRNQEAAAIGRHIETSTRSSNSRC